MLHFVVSAFRVRNEFWLGIGRIFATYVIREWIIMNLSRDNIIIYNTVLQDSLLFLQQNGNTTSEYGFDHKGERLLSTTSDTLSLVSETSIIIS
jgi:hypothetical protein